jgi:chromosome segregation ATPase
MANLGKALVHLSTDTEWRDLSQAGAALQAAEALAGDSSDAGTGMLMNALSSLIDVENNISELNTKLSNSTSEIAGLKGDLETAAAEQTALNEALEKLKAITIGN